MSEESLFIDLLAFDRETAVSFGTPVDSVKAAILLYSLPESEHHPPPIFDSSSLQNSTKSRFARQVIENSCGLMAILHLLMNGHQQFWLEDPLKLKSLLTIDSPVDAGNFIAGVDEFYDLHHKYAGFPDDDGEDEEVLYHFVAVWPRSEDGKVLIFDGRRVAPIELEAPGDAFEAICRVVEHLKTQEIEVLSAMALI